MMDGSVAPLRQPTGREASTCTIIVPCRNEKNAIGPFMDSLLAQELDDLVCEIIIADGRSDDGTAEILAHYAAEHTEIRVIDNPARIVPTDLNRAIEMARGEVIVRMDVHTIYAPDYVRMCMQVLEETGAMNVGGAARTRAEGTTARAIAAAYGSRFAVGGASFHFPDFEGPVDTVTYGCWRKSDLLALGMFDEQFVRNQDDELNLRIRKAGGLIWQDPRIRSWYCPRSSLRQLGRQYYQYGYWKVAVIRKHRIPASWRHLVPAGFVGSVSALTVGSVFLEWARWALAAEIGVYLLFVLSGAVSLVSKIGPKGFLPLAAAIPVFHVAYGCGFLRALGTSAGRRGSPDQDALTR